MIDIANHIRISFATAIFLIVMGLMPGCLTKSNGYEALAATYTSIEVTAKSCLAAHDAGVLNDAGRHACYAQMNEAYRLANIARIALDNDDDDTAEKNIDKINSITSKQNEEMKND